MNCFITVIVLSVVAVCAVMCSVPNTKMSTFKIEKVPGPLSSLGEGPHWDIERQSLYYVDIIQASVHRYDYAEDKTYNATIGEGVSVIGFITPVEGTLDRFVIGAGPKLVLIEWDGKSPKAKLIKILAELEEHEKNNRFNDGKADSFGRLYAGTIRRDEFGDIFAVADSAFYRYDAKTNNFTELKNHVSVSNGLTWNTTTNKFYYIDSREADVKEYDYNSNNGDILNEKVLIDFKVNGKRQQFVPDGMTSDENGFLYVATFGGYKVLKVNPTTKKIELEIPIPAEQVTSVAFGGPNLDILFVTTAGKEIRSPQPPPAGGLFKITGLGAKGKRMNNVVL